MSAQPKRLPGQTNADYERRDDPNLALIGTQSLQGGGSLDGVGRLYNAIADRIARRRRTRR